MIAQDKSKDLFEYKIKFSDSQIYKSPLLPQKLSEELNLEGINIALNPIGIGGPLGKWLEDISIPLIDYTFQG